MESIQTICFVIIFLLIGVQAFVSAMTMRQMLKRDEIVMRLQNAIYDHLRSSGTPKTVKKDK